VIISASRRTDIPAWFGDWFMNHLCEGSVCVSNPFNHSQQTIVSLDAAEVEAIVFWSSNVSPFLPMLKELDFHGFKEKYVFHVTVNPYGVELEGGLSPLDQRIQGIRILSHAIGRERIFWRYDPVLFSSGNTCIDLNIHLRSFCALASKLAPCVSRLFFSPLTVYRTVRSRLERLRKTTGTSVFPPPLNELCAIGQAMKEWGDAEGVRVFACAPAQELRPLLAQIGLEAGRCIDPQYLSRVIPGISISPAQARKDPGQRPECGCMISKDIGSYGTCRSQCTYCYAL